MDWDYIFNAQGWIGVGFGFILFYLGRLKGRTDQIILTEDLAGAWVNMMIDEGYIKTSQVFNEQTGTYDEVLVRFDEESKTNNQAD